MAIISELQEQEASLYDVFLSFRGEDTRLTFIDHLYRALLNENICTFLDEDEVETGEELKLELVSTIKSSRASIIVLSKNFASSTWCLNELVMILEQRKVTNHIVLPIFYHVDPTHVRKQEGSFGEAMARHKEMIETEKDQEKKSQHVHRLELWTKALTEVADLKGKEAHGRKETVFIEDIVKDINSRLGLHLQSKLPHLIGMGSSIDTISSWIKEESLDTAADFLTIWGMAGIGKTSLAEYIYKLNYHEFERSSFLEGIERKYSEQSSTALLDLQKQLLADVLKKSMTEVVDVNVCTGKIEKALINKQTLVVLDGIDNFEQLNALIGTKGFHPGSKIIITTKDRSVTEKCALFRTTVSPKHTKHNLSGLSHLESLRLLCWHAFGADSPKEGYEEEAMRIAKYCGGHPLALKVLGSSLINEDVDTWRDTFEMLDTKEFYTNIQKVLQISFDSLPSLNSQELFKHIACFFVGEDRGTTETILKECGIRASYGITKLLDRCLLTVGTKNELQMHQLVQEMGRDLVRQESPNKPWKRSRVWNHEESLKLLQENMGTSKVKGIFLDMNMLKKDPLSNVTEQKFQTVYNKIFVAVLFILRVFARFFPTFSSPHRTKIEMRTYALRKMDKLNLLQLNHVKLKGSYKNFPEGLRWLCMHGFRLKYIPSDLPMENLVALDLSYSELKQLWQKPKLLGSLKFLNVSYCKFVKIGGFSELPSLESLILAGCTSLIEVCESISGCDRLVLIDMSNCNKLKKLPSSIGKLKKVKLLLIKGCTAFNEFPIDGYDMESREVREADATLSSLTTIVPRSPKAFLVSLPQSLVLLSLEDNNLINESFPMDFSSLEMLKELHLDGNLIESVPDCVRSLSRLELLSFNRCSMLKTILCPPITMTVLCAENCQTLEKIEFDPQRLRLPIMSYQYSKSLKEIEGMIKLQDLASVDEEILCNLGWRNLQDVKDQEVPITISASPYDVKKLPIQMVYEFGIFSTYFLGKEIPNWLAYASKGSSITIILPSSLTNRSIRGFNICFVHTFLITCEVSIMGIKIWNMTKNRTWIYMGYINVVREAGPGIVWLSHWMFTDNEFEDGDEVCVAIIEDEEDGVVVKECAISPIYDFKDTDEEDPLAYYKSWKHIIGGDLRYYQLTSGDYFMFHVRSTCRQYFLLTAFSDLFRENKVLERFLGYKPQYCRMPLIR